MRARIRRPTVVILTVTVLTGASLVGAVFSTALSSSGCDSVEGPIAESQEFTPAEDRLTQPLDPAINPFGDQAMTVPEDARVSSIEGLPLRWATGSESGSVYQYFLDTEFDSELTVSKFFAAGGVQLDRDPVTGSEDFPSYVLATPGTRAVPVEIGDFKAALVWADPEVDGIRPHHLYWSDEKYNYVLMAVRSPETIVSLGRVLVCKQGS